MVRSSFSSRWTMREDAPHPIRQSRSCRGREQSFAHSGVRHALLSPWEIELCSMWRGALPLRGARCGKTLRTASGRAGATTGASRASRTPECCAQLLVIYYAFAVYFARSSSALPEAIPSWKSSFTMQTGALPQEARHSANSTENFPQGETLMG